MKSRVVIIILSNEGKCYGKAFTVKSKEELELILKDRVKDGIILKCKMTFEI